MVWLRALEGAEDILIMRGDYLSMTNSPYPPHIVGYAADIYPKYPYLPAEKGIVTRVISFPAPRNRPDAENEDYVINVDLGKHVLKILHVRPSVKPGDKLYLGDPLGELIISGYLRPWSDPHMHTEIRKKGDELRALGSLCITSTEELIKELAIRPCIKELRLGRVRWFGGYGVGRVEGRVCVSIGGRECTLDAGFPHYVVGGALCTEPANSGSALMGESRVADVISWKDNGYAVLFFNASLKVASSPLGLGTYLLTDKVKLVCLSSSCPKPEGVLKVVPFPGLRPPPWIRFLKNRGSGHGNPTGE